MGQAAARVGDLLKQDAPHCHAPIHPPAPAPTPAAHPALPLAITGPGVPTVMVGKKPAAVLGDMSAPCMLPSCVPGGPGMIAKGSATVGFIPAGFSMKSDAVYQGDCSAAEIAKAKERYLRENPGAAAPQ